MATKNQLIGRINLGKSKLHTLQSLLKNQDEALRTKDRDRVKRTNEEAQKLIDTLLPLLNQIQTDIRRLG